MKVFITGGCGFIGSNVAEYYNNRGAHVVVYDNLYTGFKENVNGLKNVIVIEDNILNYERLKCEMRGSDIVFHLASLVSVPESIKYPEKTIEINNVGTINVLRALVCNKINNIVFASSAAIYGNSDICPKKLDMYPAPISPYAITKLDGEYYLNLFSKEYNIRTVAVRFFNVFGEKQNPKSQYAAAVPIFINSALKNDNIIIYGDGMQTRDFIYIKDLVAYLNELSQRGSGVYNLGYGKPISIIDLAKIIINKTNSKSKIEYKEQRQGDVRYSYADVSKTLEYLSIDLLGFDYGLNATIDYYRGKI